MVVFLIGDKCSAKLLGKSKPLLPSNFYALKNRLKKAVFSLLLKMRNLEYQP